MEAGFYTSRLPLTDSKITVRQLAELYAPVLALSLEDPIFAGRGVPALLPCDPIGPIPDVDPAMRPVVWDAHDRDLEPSPADVIRRDQLRRLLRPQVGGNYVYYHLDRVSSEHSDILEVDGSPDEVLDLGLIDSIVLKYFFYYPMDFGVGSHLHDLEGITLFLDVDHETPLRPSLDDDGNLVSNVRSIVDGPFPVDVVLVDLVASAHGHPWYANRLRVRTPLSLPIFIIVEEGKHASAPDRNADGMFTPGFDVNRRVNDSWGIKDVMGEGYLGQASYAAWMTKNRNLNGTVHPFWRLSPDAVGPMPMSYRLRSTAELRGESEHPECLGFDGGEWGPGSRIQAPLGDAVDWIDFLPVLTSFTTMDLEGAATREGLLDPPEVTSSAVTLPNRLAVAPSVGLRMDEGPGAFIAVAGLEVAYTGGYIVPRLLVGEGNGALAVGTQVAYMGSAARWLESYVAVGAGWREDWRGPQLEYEGGFKLRLNRPEALPFWGLRLGLAARSRDVRDARFIVEIGGGIW